MPSVSTPKLVLAHRFPPQAAGGYTVPDRYYPIYVSPSGAVFDFVAGKPYSVGNGVRPTTYNGHRYKVTRAGKTGVEPTWPTTAGAKVVSGAAEFTEDGVPDYSDRGGYIRSRPHVYWRDDADAVSGTTTARNGMVLQNWLIEDEKELIRQAVRGGIDGWEIDIVGMTGGPSTTDGNWIRTVAACEAADQLRAQEGYTFTVTPILDVSGTSSSAITAAQCQKVIATFAAYNSRMMINGRMVVEAYAPETKGAAFWQSIKSTFAASNPLFFVACFLNYGANWSAFSGVADAYTHWGTRSPDANNPANVANGEPTHAGVTRWDNAHALGKLWAQPVSWQDTRPRSRVADECAGTLVLRLTWQIAGMGADLARCLTMDDRTETSAFAIDDAHGDCILQLNQRFSTRWKTGALPANDDKVFLFHRIQPFAAVPTWAGYGTPPTANMMSVRAGTTPFMDIVDFSSFFSEATRIVVKFTPTDARGTAVAPARTSEHQVPAGDQRTVDAYTSADLTSGFCQVSVDMYRGDVVQTFTSPNLIVASPEVQDLQYFACSDTFYPVAASAINHVLSGELRISA